MMRSASILLVLFAAAIVAVAQSSIRGRVVLRGTPPPEVPITVDQACAAIRPQPLTTRHFIVGRSNGLADVFVYVKDAPAESAPRSPVTLVATGCLFEPYVFGMQTGQQLIVTNADRLLHNFHPTPRNDDNRRRLGGRLQPERTRPEIFAFERTELFLSIRCDVHPWMFAYACVVEHPWFAVTDTNGNFTIPQGLPPGEYTLAAVHRKAGEQSQKI